MDLKSGRIQQNWRKCIHGKCGYNKEYQERILKNRKGPHREGWSPVNDTVSGPFLLHSLPGPAERQSWLEGSKSKCHWLTLHSLFQFFPNHQVTAYQKLHTVTGKNTALKEYDLRKKGQQIALQLSFCPKVPDIKLTSHTETVSHSSQVRTRTEGSGLSNYWSSAMNCSPFLPQASHTSWTRTSLILDIRDCFSNGPWEDRIRDTCLKMKAPRKWKVLVFPILF